MKALLLSLVIALSGSFASAACPLANSHSPFGKSGALTKSSIQKNTQSTAVAVASVKSKGVVK